MAKFVQAHWYHKGRRGYNGDGRIHGVVVHSMEAPEKGTTAESCAAYFARPDIRPSSADWCFDSNSEVECVKPTDEAYHAPPASRWTRGYEHAGYARQTAQDWHDPFSWAMLQRSATKLAQESQQFDFPLTYLDLDDLRAGRIDGVTTHNDVSDAWGQSSHWDPGPGYPMAEWLKMAEKGIHKVTPPKATTIIKRGDVGKNVEFLQSMLNILWKQRINSEGKVGGAQLRITDPARFGPRTEEAVREFQRFADAMSRLAGGKGVKVDGIVGPDTAAAIAYWVPLALKG